MATAGMSIKEMKAALSTKGIDYSSCRERAELESLLAQAIAEAASSTEDEGDVAPAASSTEDEGDVAPQTDSVATKSIRQLKDELTILGVDFSYCVEKSELQHLLRQELGQDRKRRCRQTRGFAKHRSSGRFCWIEGSGGSECTCFWDDGSSNTIPVSELAPVSQDVLPGPTACEGTFEEARAKAFDERKLLVTAVLEDARASQAQAFLKLVLASEEVASLLAENAVFWMGSVRTLRMPHSQQLAPTGSPAIAMVLPLARDAMRVLSVMTDYNKDFVVGAFVESLEALEEHLAACDARFVSERAQLRYQQDEEFAASLAADQEAEVRHQSEAELVHRAADWSDPGDLEAPPPGHHGSTTGEDDDDVAARLQAGASGASKGLQQLAQEFKAEPAPVGPTARLSLRLPSGERVERSFSADTRVSRIYAWVSCCSLLPEAGSRALVIPPQFELLTAFPRKQLGIDAREKTLADLGMTPSAALLLAKVEAE